ncbi:MAG: type II toxin-antitoxin system HicB family antitoxin [SAR324 cluster bacterium]|nr:type II toxin-antitoxin system HicB family antitoxin [SAR324 cluster bacterium]
MKILIIIEQGDHDYCCYSPDVGGCITTGETIEQTLANMKEALELHYEGILAEGYPLPVLRSAKEVIEEVNFNEGDILTSLNIEVELSTASAA